MSAFGPGRLTADQRLALVSLPTILGATMLFRIAGPSPSVQVAILAAGVSMFGLPHGALDVALGHKLVGRYPGLPWLPVFLGGYLALAGAVIASWSLAPNATLVAFLVLSVLHFGLGDAARNVPGRALEIIVRGSGPIVLPTCLKPGETGLIFDQITGADVWPGIVREIAPILGSAWIVGVTALIVARYVASTSRRDLAFLVAEIGVIVGAFALLPVLPAFALYFCALHSVRHLMDISAPGRTRARLALAALPATSVTVGVALGVFLWWRTPLGVDVAGLRVIFWGLSALTLPHMMLTALLTRPLIARSVTNGAQAATEAGSRKLMADRPLPRARVTAMSALPSASPSRSSGVTGVAPIEAPRR